MDIPRHLHSIAYCLHSSHTGPSWVPEICRVPHTTGPLHTLLPRKGIAYSLSRSLLTVHILLVPYASPSHHLAHDSRLIAWLSHSKGRQGAFLFVCLFTLVTQASSTVAGMQEKLNTSCENNEEMLKWRPVWGKEYSRQGKQFKQIPEKSDVICI